MTSQRIAQTNQHQKSEKLQASGILQRAAVRSVSDAEVQSTDHKEAQPLSNSAFSTDFSRVPISRTKPQQIMTKSMVSSVVQHKNTPASVQLGEEQASQPQEMSKVSSEVMGTFGVYKENKTGLPDKLKAGIENLSGLSMDDVKVHYNSNKPAQLKAFAYTQGTDIHVGIGQEKHLTHEAWHVVQQKQGRVKPTLQANGVAINDDQGLEKEADVMGGRVLQMREIQDREQEAPVIHKATNSKTAKPVIQGYKMTYGALHNDCGTDMHVLIKGKNDPHIKKGSRPSVKPNWWPTINNATQNVINYFNSYVVQGHLLNQDLGGAGNTMENLTPITKSTNTTHFTKIEKKVKEEVLKNGNWVEYRVRAYYNSQPQMTNLGTNIPLGVANYLSYMAGEIGADYDVYDPNTKAKISGMTGEMLVKNEGKDLKGTF